MFFDVPDGSAKEYENANYANGMHSNEKYILRLYVSGKTSKANRAIENLNKICEENLKDNYELEIIDISKNPERAIKDNIFASPTLIKELPTPIRNFIGDMSEKERVLIGLELVKSAI